MTRGLATVEEQLITYRKNEVLFSEEVAVLKREVACKDYKINVLKSEFEKVKQEKKGIEFKIEKFDKASKELDKLLGSQITDKSKKGLGYNVVPPPHPLIYNRPKKFDLSYISLDEFKEPEFKAYGSEVSKQESNVFCDKKSDDSKENFDDSLVKEQVSKDTSSFVESSLNVDKETVFPVDKKVESVKPKNHEKPVKKSVRYAEMYRSQTPWGNQRNWNGHKSNQLGSDFVMYNKACFICGSFKHVQAHCKYHQRERMVYGNNYNKVNYNYTTNKTHPNAQRNMVPRAVLMKTGIQTFNTAKTVNTAHPKSIVFSAKPMLRFSKTTQSTAQAVNTARPKAVKTARPNSAVVNAVRVNQANAGKPKQDDIGFVDSGCSRHMTGNIAYLFSGRVIPLFATMMVQATQDEGVDSGIPTDSQQTPITTQPSSSRPQKKQSRRKQRKETEVLDLEKVKDAQAKEIADLKKRVQKLERKKKSRTTRLKRLRKVGESNMVESSEDKESLDDLHDDEVIVDMSVVTTADEGVTAAKIDEITPTSAPTIVINELNLAQTLIEIKAAKPKAITTAATTTTTRPKARGVVVQEPSEFRTTTSSPQASQPSKTKDKGKAIKIEPEVPLKRKDQVALDEEMARNLEAQLQAELIEEEKMTRKMEEEANIALIESWENIQAMMETDRLLAGRLQTREQEELIDEEKAKLFMEFMEKRRKHFVALRAQEKRNRPPTKA
ncbi:hypothetical protein Tco_1106423 [Tanacetum coccineum]